MDISVNGTSLDFSLEQERTLGEVVDAVADWLSRGGMVVTDARADGDDLFQSGDDWRGKDVQAIDLVTFEANPLHLVHAEHLVTFVECLDLIVAGLEQASAVELEAFGSLEQVTEGLRTILKRRVVAPAIREALDRFDQLVPMVRNEPGSWDQELREQLDGYAKALRAVAVALHRETVEPRALLEERTNGLADSIPAAQEISVMLQSGEDERAMTTLGAFAQQAQALLSVIQSLLSTLPPAERQSVTAGISIGDGSFESFSVELNERLGELVEAFEQRDSVLIGDLVEYEIVPKGTELVAFAERLRTDLQ